MTTFELLLKKYPPQECALLSEVSDAAGASRGRSIDFMVMNLWPSRGLSLTGIERKSGRGDWLSEKKNPAKQESIIKYCDYFYLLTDNDKVAQLEEIPETWGWMHVENNRIVVKKDAPKLKPVEVSRHFLAALLKRASSKEGYVPRDSIKAEIEAAVQRSKDAEVMSRNYMQKEYDKLKKQISDFEIDTGIRFGSWNLDIKKLGKAIKFLSNGGIPELCKDIERFKNMSDRVNKEVSEVIDCLAEFKTEEN